MKKNYVRYLLLAFIFVFNFVYSIPVPPHPAAGGAGGDSDADPVPDTPINMFVIPLIILAITLIMYFSRKKSAKIQ